jgi:hypothetical protein
MSASGSASEVRVDQLAEASSVHGRVVPAMHGRDRQLSQLAHRDHVRVDVGALDLIEKWAVVDSIPGEQELSVASHNPMLPGE